MTFLVWCPKLESKDLENKNLEKNPEKKNLEKEKSRRKNFEETLILKKEISKKYYKKLDKLESYD
jgi:hypothetical protein